MASHGQPEAPINDGPEVLGVSDKNPKVRTIRVVRPEPADTSYLTATLKGIGVTVKHFKDNTIGRLMDSVLGRKGADKVNTLETIQYPEEEYKYPPRTRGLHRLMQRDDGAVRCVACMCCPTACPAHCITIIPAETDDEGIEKYPARFEIDELRCVVCGLCVEACPCDAIRMDTGTHAPPVEERGDAIMDKPHLLALGERSIAVQGGEGANWAEKKSGE
jgi:NADH-quinone oxidoreductase subunit I